MERAVVQAYNGGLGAGSRGRALGGGQGGQSSLKLKAFCCETSKGSSKFAPFVGKNAEKTPKTTHFYLCIQ